MENDSIFNEILTSGNVDILNVFFRALPKRFEKVILILTDNTMYFIKIS